MTRSPIRSHNRTVWDDFCYCWLFKLWRAYFHYEWILEEEIDSSRKHIYAELPHGIFPWGGE